MSKRLASAVVLCVLIVLPGSLLADDPPAWELVPVEPEAVTPVPPPDSGGGGGGETYGESAGIPEFTYVVTTSLDDPLCAAPLANSGAYVDVAAFGIAPAAGASGNEVAFSVNFAGGEFDFFGEDQGELIFFTDDGMIFFAPSTPGGWPPHQPIPTAADPNNMAAIFWRDFTIVEGGGAGVSLVNLTSSGMPVAAILEFDNVIDTDFTLNDCCSAHGTPGCEVQTCQDIICGLDPFCCNVQWDQFCTNAALNEPECNCFTPSYDFEIVAFYDADPTPGFYEYIFAYDNLTGDVTQGTIGLENISGLFGVEVAFDDIAVTDGMAICFDLVPLNSPPTAVCQDVTVSADEACQAVASVDGGSFDPDGDPITVEQDPPGPYPLGDTLVTLTVTDDSGESDSCTATVTVVDDTPPVLSLALEPTTLWPPNHHLVPISATVTATDNCEVVGVVLTSLTSNEPDDATGNGDGHTTGDIQLGADDFHFELRAERAGAGNGRIYAAVYTATDGSGNTTEASGFVLVPHDQGGTTDPVMLTLGTNASGSYVDWAPVEGAASYDVIRGSLGQVTSSGVVIGLGTVACVENDSLDTTTQGLEDAGVPAPGEGYFYLVEFSDGELGSTYGSVSAGKPRAPAAGGCQ